MNVYEEINQKLDLGDVDETESDGSRPYFKCGICNDSDQALKEYSEGNWKCHSCGQSGKDVVMYKAQVNDLSQGKAAQQLIQRHNLDVEFDSLSEEEKEKREQLRRVRNCLDKVVDQAVENLSTAKKQKLKEWRNWSNDTIQERKIGWMDEQLFNDLKERWGELLGKAGIHYGMTDPEHDSEGTYVIPHLTKTGKPSLVTCRHEHSEGNRYAQSKSTDFVENDIYYSTGNDSDTLVITEGYPDAISAYEEGFDAVAAGCGSFEGNKSRIAKFAEDNYEQILVVSDNDDTGEENLQSIAKYTEKLSDISVKIHQWEQDKPKGYDLDDWTSDNPDKLKQLIQDAETFLDVFRNYSPSSVDAELVNERIAARGNIKGQKQGDALPVSVRVWCKECEDEGFNVDLWSDLIKFITSRGNQHNLIQNKLSDNECQSCGESNFGFKPTEYVDKSWIQLQDLIEESQEFSITQNNKIPVYLVNDKLPSSKTVKVRGEVHVNSQNDEIFILADEIEPEEESFSQIELTQEDHRRYREEWTKEEAEKMVATDMVGRPDARTALQLTAHSPTRIPTVTGSVIRGSLRTGFFGDGGTYKSKQVKDLTKDHYRLGGFVNAENSGRTGLTYTIDNDKKVIEWGALVLNDKGLVGIDGLNELHGDELTQIREVLEDQQVEVNRSVQGSAPARTRVIGCWNPPKQLMNYENPAKALESMQMFSGPDYRRWDILVPFKDDDVDKQDIHYRNDGEKPYSEEFYKKHVKWAWNLKPSDIQFGSQFESELKTQSYNIANSFEFSKLPIVSGAFREKLTRLVVSWAVLKHSVTEDGSVKVKAEHVRQTRKFFEGLMDDLGVGDAKADFQEKNTLDEEEFEELVDKYDDKQVEILQVVHDNNPISSSEIGSQVDLSDRSVKDKWSDLKADDLLRIKSGKGASTTPRTIQFIELLHEVHVFTNDSSKGEGGQTSDNGEDSSDSGGNDGEPPPTPKQNKHESVKNVNQSVDQDYVIKLLEANDGKMYKSDFNSNEPVDKIWNLAHETDVIDEDYGIPEGSSELKNALVLTEGGSE